MRTNTETYGRIQEQLPQLNCAKDPTEDKNYTEVPGSRASRRHSSSSSPAAATEEDAGQHLEQEKSHRPQALKGVEEDTRRERRNEAIGGRPSTEAAPRPILRLDLSSPSTDPTAEGRPRQIQPATFHSTSRILEAKGQEQHHLKGDEDPSPDSCTIASKLAGGTEVEHHRGEDDLEYYSSRRRRLRLVDAAPEHKP